MKSEIQEQLKMIFKNDSEYFDICSAVALREGMTNKNYLCTTVSGRKYVLRIPGPYTSEIINRENEWSNQHRIEHLKLNVPHIEYVKKSWLKATVYIENKFDSISSKFEQIDLVCNTLKKLHKSKILFSNRFWVSEMITSYEDVMKKNKIEFDIRYRMFKNLLNKEYERSLYSSITWVACHNDLVKDNFIWDGINNMYLIDWEYSGMNDPLWDIASFILENELDNKEEDYMLKRYYVQYPTKNVKKKIVLFKIYQDLLWHLWAKIRIFHGYKYDQYSKDRLDRAIRNYEINCNGLVEFSI